MAKPPRRIAIITTNYPSPLQPAFGTFVEQFVRAVARRGMECTVICPTAIHRWTKERLFFCGRASGPPEDASVRVFRPPFLSLSSRQLGPINTMVATQWLFQRATLRVMRRLDPKPDIVYGHFLYSGGAAAVEIGKRMAIPSFVAVGEGTFWSVEPLGFARAKRDFQGARGVLAVSSVLRRRLIAELDIPDGKIGVFPNGIDPGLFYPRNRHDMRKKCGLPLDTFIVVYVGNFLAEKGVAQVAKAIAPLDGVGGVFVGSGPVEPTGRGVLFQGTVAHSRVAELLSAADVFVLPSIVEGSSNATVEAMACGLPVIVSAGEFNDDIVDDACAIRVDPMDVSAVRRAIELLRADPARRERMAAAALRKAASLDIDRRARSILAWIEERIAE